MKAFLIHLGYDLRAGLRSPTRLLMSYLFPLGFYGLMGLIMPKLNPGFEALMVPSMAIFCVLSGTLFVLPGLLVESRVAGVQRGLHIHGVPSIAVVGAPAIATALHALVAASVVGLTGPVFFGGTAPASWGGYYLVLLGVTLAAGALGVLIGVVAPSAPVSMLLSQAIFLPSMLLGGIMIGLEVLPASLRPVSGLMPTTWAMQAYHAFAEGTESLVPGPIALSILLVAGLLALALALWLFAWDPKGQERRAHPALGLVAVFPYALGILLL